MNTGRILKFALGGAGTVAATYVLWAVLLAFDIELSTNAIERPGHPFYHGLLFSDATGYLTLFLAVLSISTGAAILLRTPSREVVIGCFVIGLSPLIVGLLGHFAVAQYFLSYRIDWSMGECSDPRRWFTPNQIRGLLRIAAVRVYVGMAGSALSIPLMVMAFGCARRKANHAVEPTRALSGARGSP